MKTLEIGDKITECGFRSVTQIYVIHRVTKTQAIAKRGSSDIKFKRQYLNPMYIDKVGSDKFQRFSYRVTIEGDEQELIHRNRLALVKQSDFSKLTIGQLDLILKMFKNTNT